MQENLKITEEKVFTQDVKTMSYEELMESIRFLDQERRMIAKRVEAQDNKKTSKKSKAA